MKHCPELFLAMKNSDHNFSCLEVNPYHTEGDVWTHTMMVVNQAAINQHPIEVQLASLLHDIGKAFTRRVNPDTNYVSFRGHDGVSFYRSIGVLRKAYSDILTSEQMLTVARLCAQHSFLYTWQNKKKGTRDSDWVSTAFAGESDYLSLLAMLATNDTTGRIYAAGKNETKGTYEQYVGLNLGNGKMIDGSRPSLILLVGPPGCGKTTYIKTMDEAKESFVVSRDEIVMELGGSKSYLENWRNVDQKEVDRKLNDRFQKFLNSDKHILIDMTNMSKKSRRKWINPARRKGFNIIAIVFHTSHNDILKRNGERPGKVISLEVIHKMECAFWYPTLEEVEKVISVDW